MRALRIGTLQWQQSDGISRALSNTLSDLGYISSTIMPNSDFKSIDCLLVHGPFGSLASVINQLKATDSAQRPFFVYWMSEQLPNPAVPGWAWKYLGLSRTIFDRLIYSLFKDEQSLENGILKKLDGIARRYCYFGDLVRMRKLGFPDLLVVQSKWVGRKLSELGFRPIIVPMGFASSWYADLNLERDIQVLWLGKTGSRRRKNLLKKVRGDLKAIGVDLMVVDGCENPAVFGRERTKLLNRSKIVLNLLRANWDDNSLRYYLAAPNRSLVVSEPTYPHSPFVPGVHLVEAEVEDMASVIEHYLRTESERTKIVDAAYDLAINDLKMIHSAGRVMKFVESSIKGMEKNVL